MLRFQFEKKDGESRQHKQQRKASRGRWCSSGQQQRLRGSDGTDNTLSAAAVAVAVAQRGVGGSKRRGIERSGAVTEKRERKGTLLKN